MGTIIRKDTDTDVIREITLDHSLVEIKIQKQYTHIVSFLTIGDLTFEMSQHDMITLAEQLISVSKGE